MKYCYRCKMAEPCDCYKRKTNIIWEDPEIDPNAAILQIQEILIDIISR